MKIFDRNSDLLQYLRDGGHKPQTLGHVPGGEPIVSVKVGGDKDPAIFIAAGSHSTEHAGVGAAMTLIEELDTEHKVHVIPTRDPNGLNGMAYALSLSLGEEPDVHSVEDVEKLLRERGEVVYEEGDTLLATIGEYGYSTRGLYNRFEVGAPALESLRGRRVYFTLHEDDVEGSSPCQRAYTLIVTPEGEVLHINRFHDTAWAPVESRGLRDLMAEVNPRLTLDLHEHNAYGFWFSARHQKNDEDEQWEQRIADEMIDAVTNSGAQLKPDDYLPGSFFERQQNSVYWLIAQQRGEGLNLADFGADRYGPAFTIETGMNHPFQERVDTSVLAARTAIKIFEERHK